MPNWSGSFKIYDRIVFQTGVDYSFEYLNSLAAGKRPGKLGVWKTILKSAFHAIVETAAHIEPDLDWWEKTGRRYPVVEKLNPQERKVPVPIPLPIIQSNSNNQFGCGWSIGGLANIISGEVQECNKIM